MKVKLLKQMQRITILLYQYDKNTNYTVNDYLSYKKYKLNGIL